MSPETTPAKEMKEASFQEEHLRSRQTQPGEDIPTKMRFALHAVSYYAGQAAEKMVSLYSRTFRVEPAYRAAYYKSVGVAQAQKGRHAKAIAALQLALAITPDDHDIHLQLGASYYADDKLEPARTHLEKIQETDSAPASALFLLGMVYSRQQDYDEAIKYFKKSIELDPENAPAHYRLGIAFDNKKRYREAIAWFKKAIRLEPRCAKAHQALGFTHESAGDREAAVTCFKKALELE